VCFRLSVRQFSLSSAYVLVKDTKVMLANNIRGCIVCCAATDVGDFDCIECSMVIRPVAVLLLGAGVLEMPFADHFFV